MHQQLPWHPRQCLALGCPGGHLAAHCPPPRPPLLPCLAARPQLLRCSAAAGSLLPRLAGLVAWDSWCCPTVPCPLLKLGAAAACPAHRRAAGPAASPSVTAAPGPAAGVRGVRQGAAQRREVLLTAAMLASDGHPQVLPGQQSPARVNLFWRRRRRQHRQRRAAAAAGSGRLGGGLHVVSTAIKSS